MRSAPTQARLLIGLMVAAVAAANLIASTVSPWWTVATAAAFIGLDLAARDRLQDIAGPLISAQVVVLGALVAYVVNHDAGRIALASCAAFAAAGAVDLAAYSLLRRRRWLVRSNGSNVPAAAADSLVFPTLAFGIDPWLTLAQFAAKVGGGFVWTLLLRRGRA